VPSYVYGIVDDAAANPSGRGINDAPLQVVHGEGAAALVSELEAREQLQFGRSELMVHARVLEEALGRGTVLPMRFGVVLEGTDAVRHDLLEARAQELHMQLREMAGKVEIRVRATYEEDALLREVVKENPDIARKREALSGQPEDATYYERINLGEMISKAVDRKREADAQAFLDALAPHAAGVQVADPSHERVALNASFLVERKQMKTFEDAVEGVAAKQVGRMRVTFSDPLPPHSFVEFSGGG
jgi:hypothetical protein